jgi:hypothetical protein
MGDRRKLHYEKIHDLYFSENIIRMIISRTTRGAGAYGMYGREEKFI